MESGASAAKLSINLPPPSDEPPQAEPFEIDYANQYSGYEGEGKLALSVFGRGEEADGIRHLSSMTLRFLFFDYAFNSPCLGLLYLDGEVRCEVAGDYSIEKQEFSGQAHCTNGPADEPIPILYITPQKFYEVSIDANLQIDGNIYQYRSYRYEGDIMIDGEALKIEDLVEQGGSCS